MTYYIGALLLFMIIFGLAPAMLGIIVGLSMIAAIGEHTCRVFRGLARSAPKEGQ